MQYVHDGFKVFPTGIEKKPLTNHGLKDATMTVLGVKEYWTKWPDAGIGLVTDGLVVLDFDAAHGGLENKDTLEDTCGDLPATRVHTTGGGGLHYLYRNPNGSNVRNTVNFAGFAGVDIRANGGYIIVPPSKHKSGREYTVLDASPLASAPDWVMKLLTQRPLAAPASGNPDIIPEGERDVVLTSMAGAMRRKGMTPPAIEAALTAENKLRCNPPLSDRDIIKITASVSRYTPEPSCVTSVPPDIEKAVERANIPNKPNIPNPTEHFPNMTEHSGLAYQNISRLVERWLPLHRGETFDLDTICRQLSITDRDDRHRVVVRLYHAVESEQLHKEGKLYSYTDPTVKLINWQDAKVEDFFPLRWPYGHEDHSEFGFAATTDVSPGDVIVIAGVSNVGKTALCLNLLVENMDFHPCTLMGSEYKASKFRRRIERMDWVELLNPDGTPKFELIERYDKWADIIRPDNINIIDWLAVGDKFWSVQTIIENIQKKLNKGIAVIALQKSEYKTMGDGGGFGERLSSVYLVMDFERLTVRKVKEYRGKNPNGKMYAFKIVDGGTKFYDIQEVKPCRTCAATGSKQGKPCEMCNGSGVVSVY